MDITPVDTNAPFHLPIAAAQGLYRSGMAEALAEICVPLNEAQPGDIVAIFQDMKAHNDGVSTYPITHVVRINDDAPSYLPRHTAFMDLDQEQQTRVALACMKAQCAGLDLRKVEQLVGPLDPEAGEPYYFGVTLTPHYALINTSEFAEEVFEGAYHGEERDQEQIDMCLRLVLPTDLASNHAVLAQRPHMEEALCLTNILYPVHDDEGDVTALGLPDSSDIIVA